MNNTKEQNEFYDEGTKSSKERPLVISDHSDKLDYLFSEIDRGLDLDNDIIYLNGEIEDSSLFSVMSGFRAIQKARLLVGRNIEDPINIALSSDGGYIYEAMGIVDFIKSLSVKVNVICRGRAMSSAFLILAAGTGVRAASKNSILMMHEFSSGFEGRSTDIQVEAEFSKSLQTRIYNILKECSNKDISFWNESCKRDFFITPEQALEYKIIDKII